MDLATLFPDSILRKAEEDISKFEDKGHSHASSSGRKDTCYHLYQRSSYDSKSGKPAWKKIGQAHKKKGRIQAGKYSSRPVKAQSSYKCQSMYKLSALKKTGWEQTVFELCSLPPDRTRVRTNFKRTSCKFANSIVVSHSSAAAKERRKSGYCKTMSVIKICEQCFLCRSIVFCKTCAKCPKCCIKSACRGQAEPILENFESLGGQSQSGSNVERGLHPTLPNQTKT